MPVQPKRPPRHPHRCWAGAALVARTRHGSSSLTDPERPARALGRSPAAPRCLASHHWSCARPGLRLAVRSAPHAVPQSSAGLRCWPSERCSGGCGSWRWGARRGREGCRGGEPSSRRGLLGGCRGDFSAAQGLVFSHADPEIHRDCMTRHTTQERSPARNTSQLWRLQLAVWGSRIRTSLESTGGSTLTPTAPGGGAGAVGAGAVASLA